MSTAPRKIAGLALALVLVLAGGAAGRSVVEAEADAAADLYASEQLIDRTRPLLGQLARDLRELEFPTPWNRRLFASRVRWVGLGPGAPTPAGLRGPAGAEEWTWPLGRPQGGSPADLAPLEPLLAQIAYLDHAGLAVVTAGFPGRGRQRWKNQVKLHATGWTLDGEAIEVLGRLELTWDIPVPGTAGEDRIAAMELRDLRTLTASRRFFRAASGEALPDPATLARLRRSRHQEAVVARETEPGFEPPHPDFDHRSWDRHPGLAAGDLDGDGHEELLVTPRLGPNTLLRARGDGTFEDVTEAAGLGGIPHVAAPLFTDLDNDGDLDLLLGRTLAPSLILRNEDGRFHDRTHELVGDGFPPLVVSLSVADVNRDGLLDVYASTYALQLVTRGSTGEVLDDRELRALEDAREGRDPMLDLPGPRNRLLLGVGGGRLVPAGDGWGADLERHTFQGSFADYDGDGDADLYLANDYAPDELLRNHGSGFTPVARWAGMRQLGFGMGATWGDVDGDEDLDLYVSNMYSKAGKRVTAHVRRLAPGIRELAGGNVLYHNLGRGRFEPLRGPGGAALPHVQAGWSWGGQFLDADLDGALDLHVGSGFYTAPPRIAGSGDL